MVDGHWVFTMGWGRATNQLLAWNKVAYHRVSYNVYNSASWRGIGWESRGEWTLGVKGVMVCEWSDLGKGVNKVIDWSNDVSKNWLQIPWSNQRAGIVNSWKTNWEPKNSTKLIAFLKIHTALVSQNRNTFSRLFRMRSFHAEFIEAEYKTRKRLFHEKTIAWINNENTGTCRLEYTLRTNPGFRKGV